MAHHGMVLGTTLGPCPSPPAARPPGAASQLREPVVSPAPALCMALGTVHGRWRGEQILLTPPGWGVFGFFINVCFYRRKHFSF